MNEHTDRDRSEAPLTCPKCRNYWDTPNHALGCQAPPATASVVHADGPTAPQPSEDTRDGEKGASGPWWNDEDFATVLHVLVMHEFDGPECFICGPHTSGGNHATVILEALAPTIERIRREAPE